MARKADPTIRGRLLTAAAQEFATHGLDGAKVSAITARAGVSKGAFYLHFETKELAFDEVASRFFNGFYENMARMDALLESDADAESLLPALNELNVAMFDYLWEQRSFAKMLFEGAHSPKHCHMIEAFASGVESRIELMLHADVKAGRVRPDVDAHLLASFIAGGYDRYARLLLQREEKPDIRADVLQLQEYSYRGLAKEPRKDRLSSAPPPAAEPVHLRSEHRLTASAHQKPHLVGAQNS